MKKVLVITYYWPPAGGPGVQRWLKFISLLRDFGLVPVVYVPENASYPLLDKSLMAEVPEDIALYRHPIREPLQWTGKLLKKDARRISKGILAEESPSKIEKILLWIRANFFIPDARVLWVKPSVTYLRPILAREQIDTIITTGPPHSVHLIGKRLKELSGIPWVADFRDPWTSIGYHSKLPLGRRAVKKHLRLEKEVLAAADKILVTSNTTRREFQALTPKPVRVITNGYDANDYEGVDRKPGPHFTLAHIGSLLSGRNPEVLWRVLAELLGDDALFRKEFRLQLAGVVSPEVLRSIHRHNLDPYLELLEYLPHNEVVRLQCRARVLLLVEIDSPETSGILPGKLFEYLAAGRPVLGIGPAGWEAGAILEQTGAGSAFTYEAEAAIKKQLAEWFGRYKTGQLESGSGNIEQYSRSALTGALARELVWE